MSMQRCCPPEGLPHTDFTDAAVLLKAIADPHRLTIMASLARADEEICVCEFTEGLPLNQPTVSHHLRILREAGLVTCERRGTWVYYELADGAHERLSDALASLLKPKVKT